MKDALDITPYIVPDSFQFKQSRPTEQDYLIWRLNQQWAGVALTPPDYVGVRDYGFPRIGKGVIL